MSVSTAWDWWIKVWSEINIMFPWETAECGQCSSGFCYTTLHMILTNHLDFSTSVTTDHIPCYCLATASVLQMLLHLEPILSTPLNGSWRNFNTWHVSVGNRTLQRDFFGIGPQKIWGPKATDFWRLRNSMATLRANISSEEHDMVNRETALETTKASEHHPKISWTSGPLMAKNSTIVFSHL